MQPGPSSIPLDTSCSRLCCTTIGTPDHNNVDEENNADDVDNVDDDDNVDEDDNVDVYPDYSLYMLSLISVIIHIDN